MNLIPPHSVLNSHSNATHYYCGYYFEKNDYKGANHVDPVMFHLMSHLRAFTHEIGSECSRFSVLNVWLPLNLFGLAMMVEKSRIKCN